MDQYERLKAEIGDIAKAVNEFKNEEVQKQAFRVMVRSLIGESAVEGEPDADVDDATETTPAASSGATGARGKTRHSRAPKDATTNGTPKAPRAKVSAPTQDKTLDLHPKGKASFADFIKTKLPPDNQHDHNVVAAYWLSHEAGIAKVTVDQIFTCYRAANWNLPGDLRNSLQRTASIKNWLDTKSSEDIKVTPQGINFVERQLPPKQP
jgi:hypothetical protein